MNMATTAAAYGLKYLATLSAEVKYFHDILIHLRGYLRVVFCPSRCHPCGKSH